MESRGISAAPRQGRSCRPDECVFGDPQRFARLCVAALFDSLVRLWLPFQASNTPSQLNVFCLVLLDSSDRLSKALASKGEMVLGSCRKHGSAPDLTRHDLRHLILAVGSAHWPLTDQKLLHNTSRILRSAAVNRPPFILLAPWTSAEQPCSRTLLLLKKVQRTCMNQCQVGTPWRKRTSVLSSLVARPRAGLLLSYCLLQVIPSSCLAAVSRWPASVLLCQKPYADLLPASCRTPIVPGQPWPSIMCSSLCLFDASCACFSKIELERWVLRPQREEKMGGRIIQGGRRRLIIVLHF